jgi:hypothetical protein
MSGSSIQWAIGFALTWLVGFGLLLYKIGKFEERVTYKFKALEENQKESTVDRKEIRTALQQLERENTRRYEDLFKEIIKR